MFPYYEGLTQESILEHSNGFAGPYYQQKTAGIHLILTWISLGKKEISDHLLGIMAEQLSLSRQELNDLIDCSLGERDLISLYEQKGVL